ncbi:MAG: C40 family peptidase [Oscillospiraceae bacterium]|nr:C40 family peptidase [Oscillospiraceae bacterium]
MISLRSCIQKLLLTAGVMALMAIPANAADAPQIAYKAVVTEDSAQLMSSNSDHSDPVTDIAAFDTVVLLSDEESNGYFAASYQGEEEAYTGYIDANSLELLSVGQASVLPEVATLREEASLGADMVTRLYQDEELSILGYENGWFYVQAGDNLGYLPLAEVNCVMETTKRVNFRSGPDTDSDVLDKLSQGTVLTPKTAHGEWVQVTYEGQTGYVSSDHLTSYSSYTVKNPYRSGEAVVNFAAQYLGNRYVWGGTSLEKGCDCSGYVMRVFEQFGVELPHSSYSIRNYGEKVSYEDMEIGDVVCYRGHVGIYAGNGQIINALNSRAGICYTDVNYSTIVTIRRML